MDGRRLFAFVTTRKMGVNAHELKCFFSVPPTRRATTSGLLSADVTEDLAAFVIETAICDTGGNGDSDLPLLSVGGEQS